MTPVSIMVLGDVVTDVVVRMREPLALGSDAAASISTHGGGAGGNVAAWFAAAGAASTLVARIGDDEAGRMLTGTLADAGITTALALDPAEPTGTVVVLVDPSGERSMLPDRGANLRLVPDDVSDEALAAADHLHVSGYLLLDAQPRPAAQHALARAAELGTTTSVDPSSAGPLRHLGPQRFLSLIDGVDLVTPNLDELEVLTGTRDAAAGAQALTAHCREVVVTLGARGALWTDGRSTCTVDARRVDAIDTTGAGDAFLAGYLTARVGGAEPADALAAGITLASVAVTAPGARPRGNLGGTPGGVGAGGRPGGGGAVVEAGADAAGGSVGGGGGVVEDGADAAGGSETPAAGPGGDDSVGSSP